MNKKFYPATNDVFFKAIFANENNQGIIKSFLSSILDIPREEYDNIQVADPFFKIEDNANDKLGILDVKLKLKNGKIVDIEMQLVFKENMRERVIFYISKMTTEQIEKGGKYSDIKKVVSIIIAADHNVVKENDKCHNRFLLRNEEGIIFTDKIEVDTLELLKLPKNINETLEDWIKFLNAKSEEDMDMIAQKAETDVCKAAELVLKFNQDSEMRVLAEQRENALREYRSELQMTMEKGIKQGIEQGVEKQKGLEKIEIAKNSLKRGLDVETISVITGLSPMEIEKLK